MAVTQPRAGVPIGFVEIGGRRVPVQVDPEYLRYFTTLGTGVAGITTDHGSLTGLSDDDHPQYLNTARGDARYASIGAGTFPIGAIYINVTGTNPAAELGYGTWSAFGAGRVLVGVDTGDTDFDTVMETGGSKTATF